MKFTKKTIYIGLFSILYLIVAFSSFFHAVSFFGLANNSWMSIILAFAFEVGQAAVLFSLLTSVKDRSRIMPWVLMIMFTLVQVIGNVYSSYKYIIMNSVDNLRFFKEPIFIWTELPDAQANVIIVYLVGAILPIAALLLTSMITNYLSDQEALELGEEVEDETEDDDEAENDILNVELEKKEEEIEKLKQELETERSVHQDISEEYPKVVEENNKKDEEIEKLRQEIEQLKENTDETEKDAETFCDNGSNDSLQQENENVEQSEITKSENDNEDSIEHIEESNGQESNTGGSEPKVDDTISEGTGVEETTEEELVKEPMEEDIQKRESHFINL